MSETSKTSPVICPDCGQEAKLVRRFYSDGRPLFRCPNGHEMVDMNDEPSFKGLALLRSDHDVA